MYGYLEQIHLMTRHQGIPIFEAPQKTRQVPVDTGGTRGLQRLEEVFDYPTYPG
jgi:hypothetical protein